MEVSRLYYNELRWAGGDWSGESVLGWLGSNCMTRLYIDAYFSR
jgi:hypothetical protein